MSGKYNLTLKTTYVSHNEFTDSGNFYQKCSRKSFEQLACMKLNLIKFNRIIPNIKISTYSPMTMTHLTCNIQVDEYLKTNEILAN